MNLYLKVKRILSFFMAFVSLIILSPLFLIIAFLIKIDSKGPVFFKQERLGKDGEVFKIYKFRTMVDNAINMGAGLSTSKDDPRITKVGKVLRETSIDELPQLLNVIKGEMSFIGPRPPVPYHPYEYKDYPKRYKKRFSVLPGITGLAQVKVRNSVSWDDRFEYDIEYIENLGLKNDIYIFLYSIVVIIRRKNIYDR